MYYICCIDTEEIIYELLIRNGILFNKPVYPNITFEFHKVNEDKIKKQLNNLDLMVHYKRISQNITEIILLTPEELKIDK